MSILADYARDRFPEVAAKAPDDATLEAYIRDRFPEIAAKVDVAPAPAPEPTRRGPPGPMGMYGGVPGDQANINGSTVRHWSDPDMSLSPSPMNNPLSRAAKDVVLGGVKDAVGTGTDLLEMMSGGRGQASPDFRAALEHQNTAQQIGGFTERMAEFAIPGGAVSRGVKAVGMGPAITTGLDAAGQALVAGGVDLLHGKDMATAKRDAAIAAAFPVIGAGINKALTGASNSFVNSFFKQSRKEAKMGIANEGVAQTLSKEQITGLRAQTLRDRVNDKVVELSQKLDADVTASNNPNNTVDLSGKVTGMFDFFGRRAELLNVDSAKRIRDAGTAIVEKIAEISPSRRLDAAGLNSLRKHIGEMLDRAGPDKDYKNSLKKAYALTRELVEQRVPTGVKKDLWRLSNLINTRSNIDAKMEALKNVGKGSVLDGTLTGLSVFPNSFQGIAVPALVTKMGYRALQYTPGRMMAANTVRGAGGLAGAIGAIAPAVAVGMTNSGAEQPPMPSAPGAIPSPMQQPEAPQIGGPLAMQIDSAASAANVDPILLAALVQAESAGNPAARSPKGAVGLTQMTPIALKEIGMTKDDIASPEGQLLAGAKYLRLLLDNYNGNVTLALAAYNAGPGAVNKHKGVPPFKETQAYVPRVLRYYVELGGTRDQTPVAGS